MGAVLLAFFELVGTLDKRLRVLFEYISVQVARTTENDWLCGIEGSKSRYGFFRVVNRNALDIFGESGKACASE